jgi:hypothetical protein
MFFVLDFIVHYLLNILTKHTKVTTAYVNGPVEIGA